MLWNSTFSLLWCALTFANYRQTSFYTLVISKKVGINQKGTNQTWHSHKKQWNRWGLEANIPMTASSYTVHTYTYILSLSLSLLQQPKFSLSCLTVKVSRSHTIRHTHQVWFLWISDQLITEATTYTTHNRYMTWHEHPSLRKIWTCNSSNQADADICLRLHSHQHQHIYLF
jgi:hypothetical protein